MAVAKEIGSVDINNFQLFFPCGVTVHRRN